MVDHSSSKRSMSIRVRLGINYYNVNYWNKGKKISNKFNKNFYY
jgi:hypothetical protein